MRKIKWYLDTGFGKGCRHEDIIEVEDDATDEDIEKLVKEEAFNRVDWGWEEVPDIKPDLVMSTGDVMRQLLDLDAKFSEGEGVAKDERDATMDKRTAAILLNNILEDNPSFTDDFEEVYSTVCYWIRRAKALESLLSNNLEDIALHDFCPDHECSGGSCESTDAEEAIDCRAWCWQKAIERCGDE